MNGPLTDREQLVLELLAAGFTNSLYAKLGARTAAEAVSLGYRRGLLSLGPRDGYRLALVRIA